MIRLRVNVSEIISRERSICPEFSPPGNTGASHSRVRARAMSDHRRGGRNWPPDRIKIAIMFPPILVAAVLFAPRGPMVASRDFPAEEQWAAALACVRITSGKHG